MSQNNALVNLTHREQEIFGLLLAGTAPKEIAYTLNISYDTVLVHQKKLYRKLDVKSIQELLAKYSTKDGTAAVINRWRTFTDDLGSRITVKPDIEYIQEQNFATCTICGEMTFDRMGFVGATAELDPAAHEAIKKMSSFCFTVFGDGNTYEVMLTTTDTLFEGECNHYRKAFTTKKHEITTVTVDINELVQSPLYGKKVPFIQNNIEFLQFQVYSTGEFNLKVWNIRFNE